MKEEREAKKLSGEYSITGHGVLVEHLTPQESMGTMLSVSDRSQVVYYQAFVQQIGPMVKPDEWGFKVGDRILLSGNSVPVPRRKDDMNPRNLGVIDPTSIRCILKESDE
jgi:hypothetical protein